MERLVCEISRLAREIQRDIEELPTRAYHSNGSVESAGSAQRLERIERKLEAVHEDTGEIIRRVPKDLGGMLADLKRSMLLRLEVAAQSNESADSSTSHHEIAPNHSNRSVATMVKLLTSQERHVFQLCFQSGFLTYRDIAEHLDITAGAAKNLVNRIFQSDKKRPLFTKQYKHGSARIGLQPDLQSRILTGSSRGSRKKRLAVT